MPRCEVASLVLCKEVTPCYEVVWELASYSARGEINSVYEYQHAKEPTIGLCPELLHAWVVQVMPSHPWSCYLIILEDKLGIVNLFIVTVSPFLCIFTLFRGSLHSSMSEKHFMGPLMSVCLSRFFVEDRKPAWPWLLLHNSGNHGSILDTLLHNSRNWGHCWNTVVQQWP
jgi:hypothetical protein